MGQITTSNNISIEINPWTSIKDDKGVACWSVYLLNMFEEVGCDSVGYGRAELWNDGSEAALNSVTEVTTGEILLNDNKEGGVSYRIPFFITNRHPFNNILQIEFICAGNVDFSTKRVSMTYTDGIKEAIEATFPGNTNLIEPGVVDSPVYYQMCETNLEFNRRLVKSYKSDTIFGYGWEGLFIKELHNTEPTMSLEGGRLMNNKTVPSLKYNKSVNHSPYKPFEIKPSEISDNTTSMDYVEDNSKNSSVVMSYENYYIVGKEFEDNIANLDINNNFLSSKGYSELIIVGQDMPNYKLGDVILYEKRDTNTKTRVPYKKYLVGSNEFFFAGQGSNKVDSNGFNLSWTTKLYGLEEGTWSKDIEEIPHYDKDK